MPKFPSKVKVINIKLEKYYIMDFEGAFFKSGGAMALWTPPVPTSLGDDNNIS